MTSLEMAYKSDLSDAEWDLIKNDFEPASKRGNGHKHSKKIVVDAILYIVKGGIQWRLMPNDFPPWQTVCDHFSMSNGVENFPVKSVEKFPVRVQGYCFSAAFFRCLNR